MIEGSMGIQAVPPDLLAIRKIVSGDEVSAMGNQIISLFVPIHRGRGIGVLVFVRGTRGSGAAPNLVAVVRIQTNEQRVLGVRTHVSMNELKIESAGIQNRSAGHAELD